MLFNAKVFEANGFVGSTLAVEVAFVLLEPAVAFAGGDPLAVEFAEMLPTLLGC
jgi:hypothetical protein